MTSPGNDGHDVATRAVTVDHDAIIARLGEWLRIPSISASPAHADDVRASASWLADACRNAGFSTVEIWDTPGHPAVFAEWSGAGDDAVTMLVYGHHDVQPVDPISEWNSPPFEPTIVGDECFARGAIDDKGQVAYHVEAVRALLAAHDSVPVNVKLLIEGEEEIGSPHFEQLLVAHVDRLDADVIVVSDTSMIAPDVPSIDVAMRGLVAATVTLTTSTTDLHSGTFGGAVPNPLHHLTHLVAALHDEDRHISIDGFYDDVVELTSAEQASLDTQPFDEEAFRRLAGTAVLEGETGYTTLERVGARPTAEVVGIVGGYTGEGIKTIVPARASAKLTFRLVPDQDPGRIMALVEDWIRTRVAEGIDVTVTWHGGVAPARSATDHWTFHAVQRAIESVWGEPPLLTRVGGSGPEETLARVLATPLVFLGVGLPGDRIHAPNERLDLAQFRRGLRAVGALYDELAAASTTSGNT